MSEQDQEPLLDLGKSPHRTRGRGLSLPERIRVARRLPQAVVKVTSFSKGIRGVLKNLHYISRDGSLFLEKDSGEILKSKAMQKELAETWSIDFDTRKNSRDTANIVFSMPRGSDPEALRRSIRITGARAFPDHEWVFAIHEDRQHPHAHMMVKMRGMIEGKKLQLRKAELYRLRELFAEAAREQGIRLAASPRAARGVGEKGVRQGLYHLHRKGIVPRVEKDAYTEVLLELKKGQLSEKPWERAMAQRHALEKEYSLLQAESLRQAAEHKQGTERERLMKAAQDLEQFARALPKPKTRRQSIIEKSFPTPPLAKGQARTSHLELDR